MSLYQLIYSSRALSNVGYPDLKQIMNSSEKNNSPVGLTGMLCFGNGMFLQILEGDRRAINHTYHRIAKDERHYNPEIIAFDQIEHRYFGVWSMKSVQLSGDLPEIQKNLLLKYSSLPSFMPESMGAKQSLGFMVELAETYS